MAKGVARALAAAPLGRSSRPAAAPTDTIATMVSSVLPRPMRVAVPRDAVAAVAVVAEPGRAERLPELGRVVGGQRVAGLTRSGSGRASSSS